MALFADRYGRWGSILPGRGFADLLRGYLASVQREVPLQFLGHNPIGLLAVTLMLLLMLVLAVSGLVPVGTDVYYPPFGQVHQYAACAPMAVILVHVIFAVRVEARKVTASSLPFMGNTVAASAAQRFLENACRLLPV